MRVLLASSASTEFADALFLIACSGTQHWWGVHTWCVLWMSDVVSWAKRVTCGHSMTQPVHTLLAHGYVSLTISKLKMGKLRTFKTNINRRRKNHSCWWECDIPLQCQAGCTNHGTLRWSHLNCKFRKWLANTCSILHGKKYVCEDRMSINNIKQRIP